MATKKAGAKKAVKKAAVKKAVKKAVAKKATKKATKKSAAKKPAAKKATKKATKKTTQPDPQGDDRPEEISGGITVDAKGDFDDFEDLPDDEYLNVTLLKYGQREVANQWQGGKMEKRILFTFQCTEYVYEDENGDEQPRLVWGMVKLSLHKKSKLYEWMRDGFLGRAVAKDEHVELDDLIGQDFRVQLKTNHKDDGSTSQWVNSVRPAKSASKATKKGAGKKEVAEEVEYDLSDLSAVAEAQGVEDDLSEMEVADAAQFLKDSYDFDPETLDEQQTAVLVYFEIIEAPEEEPEEETEVDLNALKMLVHTHTEEKVVKSDTVESLTGKLQGYEFDADAFDEEEWAILVAIGVVEGETVEEETAEVAEVAAAEGEEPDLSFLD